MHLETAMGQCVRRLLELHSLGDGRKTGNGPGLRAQWLVCTLLFSVGSVLYTVFSLQLAQFSARCVLSYMNLALAGWLAEIISWTVFCCKVHVPCSKVKWSLVLVPFLMVFGVLISLPVTDTESSGRVSVRDRVSPSPWEGSMSLI